ncbi:MAG: protein-L-isoaspartate(D-aspartate) O-methyltransferase [Roseiflexaceae bacterium]
MEGTAERDEMVRSQLMERGIRDQRVLDAMRRVPRHLFVPQEVRREAYADRALPIEQGQTISQPFVVALMAQALELRGDERLLEIGTGSGYAAAVLSLLAAEVYTVERWPALAETASQRLHDLGYANVQVFCSDGTDGLPAYAPFDAITVAAASPWVPRPLREQMSLNSRLVIPVGSRDEQMLIRLTRRDAQTTTERLSGVRFVPLIGAHAWDNLERER